MTNIKERKKTLEVVLQQKMTQLQQMETQRNNLLTEIVQLQGKVELLDELERESSEKKPEETKEESK